MIRVKDEQQIIELSKSSNELLFSSHFALQIIAAIRGCPSSRE
jgi:hypothetical protein